MSAVDVAPSRGRLAPAECIFCQLVAGDLPCHQVYADAAAIAFLDARPASPGHTLVVPRRHVEHLWDGDARSFAAVAETVHAVAALLRERLRPDGLTMRQNTGAASGQDVFHLHVHLVPRWHGDGHIGWPNRPDPAPDPHEILRQLIDPSSIR
ncbi:MAG TPA: HIT domain-containing protein [Mycobacteriales bacterium]|jgi:histidine triad (HIT) family protein|nr:HIT domain-containing protein [Mycobacteriales bacterium]